MEVPVVKIREGEAGGEEKMMIKSIVNMVQYSVWGSDTDGEVGTCCMDLQLHCASHPQLVDAL